MFNLPEISISGSPEAYSRKVDGVMVAVVTNNNDPDNKGRVKLKFPLQETDTETDWVRISTLMAGKEMGSLFLPEVNDEVLVAFHLGESSQPIVIGALWNDKNKPPAPAEKNDIRKIKSRSGHELIFNDKSGDEGITVKTKKGHIIEFIDKEDHIKISEKSGKNIISIKGGSANEISVKSNTSTITLNAKGEIEITSNQDIKIKSTQIKIEASATMELKAAASLDIKSDGMINIKGSMVKIN